MIVQGLESVLLGCDGFMMQNLMNIMNIMNNIISLNIATDEYTG